MRQKSRKDLNQTAVVKELRERGYTVDIVERPYDIVVSGEKHKYPEMPNYRPQFGDILCYTIPCSLRVELKSEKGKLSESQLEYIENLKYPDSYMVATSSAEDPMPAVKKIVDWFGG